MVWKVLRKLGVQSGFKTISSSDHCDKDRISIMKQKTWLWAKHERKHKRAEKKKVL